MSSSTTDKFLSTKLPANYAGGGKNFTVWDANRETLKRLFLTENCTLKAVKRRMETEHGFPTFPLIDYETTLRDHYGFRKNLKASDWYSIGYHVESRRLHGKASYVYLGGSLQEPRKVEREIRRYTKRSVLRSRIRRNCAPPPLDQNLSIRTPSPEPQKKGNAVIRALSAAEMTVLSQFIEALRLQSPFNNFISICMEQVMPNSNKMMAIEIARRTSVPEMEISTPLGQGSDFAFLSQSCFILSNNLDSDSIFTKPLLNWIEISAEVHVLKGFFSIKSSTIKSVWDSLYNSSIRLGRLRAYSILVEIGLSMNKGQWVTQRSSCLIDAIHMKAKDEVKELLKQSNIDPNSAIPYGQIPGLVPPLYGHNMISPLALAAYVCDLDIIEILLNNGTDINPPLPRAGETSVVPPLFSALQFGHYHPKLEGTISASTMHCICALLDAGSNVDIYENYGSTKPPSRWGWSAPGYPSWLIDYAWTHFPRNDSLLTYLSNKSFKMQNEVTVTGVCLAASQGHRHLQQYLASRELPIGLDRTAVLQIALSEAAGHGLSEIMSCLLQIGVDPNVKYIEDDLESRSDSTNYYSWHPAVRAAQGQHDNILGILRNMSINSQPLSIIEKFFRTDNVASHFHTGDAVTSPYSTKDSELPMATAPSLVDLFRPRIEIDGRSLILLFLKRAYQKNFLTCAKACDMAWSWGVPQVIGDDGRDALHYAIFHNCGLDMIKFLIARGYRVHSKLAYDYDYQSLNSPSVVDTGGPYPHYRSSMLGDALISYADDRLAIVNFLLEEGASTENVREHYTLLESVFFRNSSCRKYRDDTVEIFKKLFYANAPVNGPRQQASHHSLLTSLMYSNADDALISQVIDATQDIDEYVAGYTPLLAALYTNRLPIAKQLLDRGAKVDNDAYTGHSTPLEVACHMQDVPIEFIEDLIRLGADINPRMTCRGSRTPLHAAAGAGKLNVAALLLKRGADININVGYEFDGRLYITPLDYAAMNGRLDMTHLLRGLGGKSGLPGKTGVDGAISLARQKGYYAVAEFLRDCF
ncbi:hypothetical protein F5X98DRAFT_391945 [Xylaria grammica]|nr:hypothetical protein F5X98DRAFT_391945 [Xylaria grammica]